MQIDLQVPMVITSGPDGINLKFTREGNVYYQFGCKSRSRRNKELTVFMEEK
jgi:hypothetical protein